MLNIAPAVANLQANWHRLPDFERAQAVLSIVRTGINRRQLAIALHVSEGTVRNLLLILEADPGDVALFRRGQISRNELLRRVRGINSDSESSRQLPERPTQPPIPPSKHTARFTPLPLLPLIPVRNAKRLSA